MLAISVSRLNLNLDEELSQALIPQSPTSLPGSDISWEGCTSVTQQNTIAAGAPAQHSGDVSHSTPGRNARDRRLRRATRSFAVYPTPLTGRGRSNAAVRLLSQTPPTTPIEGSHNRSRRVSIESNILPLCTQPDDPHAVPASCMARRLSSPPFASPYGPDNRSIQAAIQENATTASRSVPQQKLGSELQWTDDHMVVGCGNQNEPLPIARQEIVEGPLEAAQFRTSPLEQRAFSIVEEHEIEEDDNYVDMIHDLEATVNAGVSASASVRSSEEEVSTRSDRPISFSADRRHSSVCADVVENRCSTVRKKASRGYDKSRNIGAGGGQGPDKSEPMINGLVPAAEDANIRFSLDSFAGSPQDMYAYTSGNVHNERTASPRAENLTRRQHTYLFKVLRLSLQDSSPVVCRCGFYQTSYSDWNYCQNY